MFAAVLFAVSAVAFVYITWQRLRQQPPGPWGLPVVGNLLQMDLAAPHEPLLRWARRYGAVFQVHMGALPIVAVSDPALLRDVLGRTEVSGRPDTISRRRLLDGARREGIARAEGELWHETRRLLLQQLQGLDGADSQLQRSVQKMADDFVNGFVRNNVGRQVQLGHELQAAVVNIIWGVVTGERLGVDDTDVQETVAAAGRVMHQWQVASLADALPWAEQLALLLLPPDLPHALDEQAERLVEPAVRRHRAALQHDAEPRDYIDAYLLEMRRRPLLLNEAHLTHSVLDILLQGSEPTVATLEWAVCFLCSRPDVQRRVQHEIDATVGRARAPRCDDRARMPFTEAVLMETQRLGDVTPLGLPHTAARDLSLAGYKVTRGTQITPLLRAVHLDERLFPEPLAFRPERFVDAAGRLLPSDGLLPFLTGRRRCPGEALAAAQLFLLVTALLQRFSLRFPEGFQHDFSANRDNLHVLRPRPFKFVPELRAEEAEE